jgi:murein DD-endopeptidase MepM/ murein hydrolase activator NlpD
MPEFPQATSRRELRERERAAELSSSRPQAGRRDRGSRARAVEKARPVRSGSTPRPSARQVERRGSRARTIGSRLLSLAAMIFAAAFVVGVSLPANAFFSPSTDSGNSLSASTTKAGQSVAVSGDEKVDVGSRDKVQVLSWAQVLASKYNNGAKVGGAGTGPIRWPFPFPVHISSGFGPRIAPCGGCSTYHEGVDMVPGDKAAIFSSSTGVVTVRDAGPDYGSYGNVVVITTQYNGHTVKFTYAHMTTGSSALVLGEKVNVGDFIGLVGETGEATGPHLHFEVNVDGTTIDPIPWMTANTGIGGTN